jgi:hypothetical protein
VTIMWGSDHCTNPSWLPKYLECLLSCLPTEQVDADVFAYSRGAAALMFCLVLS